MQLPAACSTQGYDCAVTCSVPQVLLNALAVDRTSTQQHNVPALQRLSELPSLLGASLVNDPAAPPASPCAAVLPAALRASAGAAAALLMPDLGAVEAAAGTQLLSIGALAPAGLTMTWCCLPLVLLG